MRIKTTRYACLFIVLTLALTAAAAHAGKTLDAVMARGDVRCGVSTGVAGFAVADSAGTWTGLDADFCSRAGRFGCSGILPR